MKLKSFSELVSQAYSLYKKNMNALALIAVIPVVFSGAFTAVSSLVGYSLISSVLFGVFAVALAVAAIVFNVIFPVVLVRSVDNAARAGHIGDISELYRSALKDFFPYILVALITLGAVAGGTVLFVIPGLVAAFYLLFSVFAYSITGERGVNALVASARLVRGQEWPVFSRVFLSFIFLAIATIVISLIIGIITHVLSSGDEVSRFLNSLFSSILIVPLYVSFMYYLFMDLKDAKETETAQVVEAGAPTSVQTATVAQATTAPAESTADAAFTKTSKMVIWSLVILAVVTIVAAGIYVLTIIIK